MRKAVRFVGTAHPPAARTKSHVADLSSAEIASLNLGKNKAGAQTDLLVEHKGLPIGQCDASWQGQQGEMRVSGRVFDHETAASMRCGRIAGLSLGTGTLTHPDGVLRTVEELSLCKAPARAGCYVTHIDGKRVRHLYNASAGGPDNYSRDMVEQLKRERLELSSKVAQLESRNTRLETRERDTLRALVPQMQTGTKMLMENPRYKDHAEDLKHMHDWAGSCVDRQDVETTTRLARFVHCASAEIATAHSEGTKMGDAAEELKRAHAELDEAKASTEVLSKKLRESQELQQEHYAQAQSFEKRLHTAGLVQEKHDFSKVASREVPPQKKQQEFDPLMAMIKAHSSGTCTTRLMPNDSTNAITGGATSSLPFSAYAI